MSKAANEFLAIAVFPTLVKVYGSDKIHSAVTLNKELWDDITAFGVDGDGILMVYNGIVYTWNDAMALEGMTPEMLAQMNIIEITEEEFLNKTFE